MLNLKGIKSFFLLLLLLFYSNTASGQQHSPFILELSSQDSKPYKLVLAAFKQYFSQYFPDAEYKHHLIGSKNEKDPLSIIQEEMQQSPTLILGLGTKAIEVARSHFPDTPLVASMILKDDNMHKSRVPSISILLQIPPATQMYWLTQFLPYVRKVGILYDPKRSSDLIKAYQESSQATGVEIVAIQVNSIKQLLSSLQYINTHADALLAIPDATIYSGKTAKEVLLFTYRNRIPFVGLSSTWVKAGALYALEANYADIGKKCAESAQQILAGKPLGAPPLLSKDNVTYTINTKTAQYLRLDMDSSLISGGSKIFQ